jgi:serine/threonine protein kinase
MSVSAKKTPATRTRVGRYELGRTLGEGTFAKVKFAKNLETAENVAIKILDRDQVFRHKMVEHVTACFLLLLLLLLLRIKSYNNYLFSS